MKYVDSVAIETKNLNLEDLREQAAHRLALFLEREKKDPGTAVERGKIVHGLISELEHLSTRSGTLSRKAFVALLTKWIRAAHKKGGPIEDFSRIGHSDTAKLIGRADELELLNKVWTKTLRHTLGRPRILTLVAIGGQGKTSLVSRWTADLVRHEGRSYEAAFAWSFYRQGTREHTPSSSDLFLKEALLFFDEDRQFAASNADPSEKGKRLARIVAQPRRLLILDGLEPLQHAPNSSSPGELKDQGVASLLLALAAAKDNRGLCIVTTRYPISNLKRFWQDKTVKEVNLPPLSRGPSSFCMSLA